MNPKEMTDDDLLHHYVNNYARSCGTITPEDMENYGRLHINLHAEILRRLNEADALRKENEELRKSPTINWHEGPARGGGGSFGKDSKGRALWGDGDRLLIAVELSNGGLDIAKVVISTDGETFAVLIDDDTGDNYGDWSPDDWSWWAKDYDENPRLWSDKAKESEASHE